MVGSDGKTVSGPRGPERHRAVIELSGGLDSVVLAHWAKSQGEYDLSALTFNYGQFAHERELGSAKRTTYELGIPHEVVQIPGLRQMMTGIIDPPYAMVTETLPETWAPVCDDSCMTTSIAGTYAQLRGFDRLLLAVNADDLRNLATIPRVYAAVEETIRAQSRNENFRIELPFLKLSKVDIIQMGRRFDVNFAETWSCWWADVIHCGTCPPCVRRQGAFAKARIKDPTRYKTPGPELKVETIRGSIRAPAITASMSR